MNLMMRFPGTFPKAVLIFVLVATALFMSAQGVSAAEFKYPISELGNCGSKDECLDYCKRPATEDAGETCIEFAESIMSSGGINIPFVGGIAGKILGGIAEAIFKGVADLLKFLIVVVASLFVWIANTLIDAALTVNNDLALGKESMVITGHKIALGVANMGFIVALVAIAFATMFRSDAFGYKKALPRVVIAALLINFGYFMVTNWLLSPVNQVTEAFRSASNFGIDNSFSFLKNMGSLNSFLEGQSGGVSGWIGEVGKTFASVLFTAMFSLFMILALMAFAAMLFTRYIALSILIILLPIAWITWIFPNLKIPGGHPWTVWWENFTRWLLFAPIAMFFFYLAVGLSNKEGFIPPAGANFSEYLGQTIVIVGLLLGGLIAANKLGISGGAMALGAASAGKKWVKGLARDRATLIKDRAFRKTLESKAVDERATRMAALGGFQGFVGRRAIMAKAAARKGVEEAIKKKYANLAPYEKVAIYDGLSEADRKIVNADITATNFQWEGTEKSRRDIVKWHKDGNVFPHDRKFMNNLIERGIDPAVLAAEEDLFEGLRTHTPDLFGEMDEVAKQFMRGEIDAGERRNTIKDLEDEASKKSKVVQELIEAKNEAHSEMGRVLGSKGYPQTDARLMGKPGEFKQFGPGEDPLRATLYTTHFTEGFRTVAPGSLNARLSSGRGSNVPVIIGEVEGAIKDIDNEIIGRLAGSIESSIRAEIETIEKSDASPASKISMISAKEAESRRLKDLTSATPADRNSWIQKNWKELLRLERADPEQFKRTGNLIRQGQQQLEGSINQLFVTGKKAYIMSFIPAEGSAPIPPPA